MGFVRNIIPFLFEHKREGYKRYTDCIVVTCKGGLLSNSLFKLPDFAKKRNVWWINTTTPQKLLATGLK